MRQSSSRNRARSKPKLLKKIVHDGQLGRKDISLFPDSKTLPCSFPDNLFFAWPPSVFKKSSLLPGSSHAAAPRNLSLLLQFRQTAKSLPYSDRKLIPSATSFVHTVSCY